MNHIRIISPSGAIDPAYIDLAAERLRSWGYEVSEGLHARGQYGRFAAKDEERLADIHAAFADESVDIILCARGGYGLQRIIDRVDFSLLERRRTKPLLVGFSDITALHLQLSLRGIPSIHGLMCKHLSTLEDESVLIYAWRAAVGGENLCYDLPTHPLNRGQQMKGRLVGGNLSVIYGLQGTPYGLSSIINNQSSIAKPILFLEDIAERHYHIDRMMNNLRMSGVLAQLGGLVVGQFTDCKEDESMSETVYETIRRAVADYDYPVVFGFPAGHGEHNISFVLGCEVEFRLEPERVRMINTQKK